MESSTRVHFLDSSFKRVRVNRLFDGQNEKIHKISDGFVYVIVQFVTRECLLMLLFFVGFFSILHFDILCIKSDFIFIVENFMMKK